MTFPYVIDWTPQLRDELALVVMRDSFGGHVWPVARPRMRLVEHRFDPKNPLIPCPRCGWERPVKNNDRSKLCRDCKGILTADEREAWAA